MNVTFDKQVEDAICMVTVSTGSFTQQEQDLMSALGEPLVDIGGEFYLPPSATPIPLPATPTASPLPPVLPVYVHSNSLKHINTDFGDVKTPFTIIFDGNAVGVEQAIANANVWIATMKLRFADAMVKLRAQVDNFTGTETETI